MSTTETIGFGTQLVQLMQDNKMDLLAKGLDVTAWITQDEAQLNDAVTKSSEQDDALANYKLKTTDAQTSIKTLYKGCSSHLDAIIGVLGKGTPVAKQAARLRSGIIKQSKSKTTVKPKPQNP